MCASGTRDPKQTEPELCLSVSYRDTGQQWITAGAGALSAVDLGMAQARLEEVTINHTIISVQFSSVTKSCLTLWDPINCSMPGIPVITNSQSLLKLMSIESVMPSDHPSSVVPFSSHLQSFPVSGSLHMSQFFTSGGQSNGVSASASVLPMNIPD